MFTLTITSTGGPATEVDWTLDGSLANGTESQTVTDTETADYTNTLTVTGRHIGVYTCSVDNVRTANPATRTLTVTGECFDTVVHRYTVIHSYVHLYKSLTMFGLSQSIKTR